MFLEIEPQLVIPTWRLHVRASPCETPSAEEMIGTLRSNDLEETRCRSSTARETATSGSIVGRDLRCGGVGPTRGQALTTGCTRGCGGKGGGGAAGSCASHDVGGRVEVVPREPGPTVWILVVVLHGALWSTESREGCGKEGRPR